MDLEVKHAPGYELLASGDGRKLERLGAMLLDRPAPQAIWMRQEDALWENAHAVFERKEGGSGEWTRRAKNMPESWPIRMAPLTFEIHLTSFGNIGLFPEHMCHFDWLVEKIERRNSAQILNLFAYTGGASMACAMAGATVTHVDAAKSVNAWARTNAELSDIPRERIRFLAEDAMKFAKREVRRSRRYDGIILDPPTFGRGAQGEVWKVEQDLHELLDICLSLLSLDPLFVLLTSHSPGITPRVLKAMLAPFGGSVEFGEMLLLGRGPALPQGAYARWSPG